MKNENKMTRIIDEYGIDLIISNEEFNKGFIMTNIEKMKLASEANIVGVLIENHIKIIKCKYDSPLEGFYIPTEDYPEYFL